MWSYCTRLKLCQQTRLMKLHCAKVISLWLYSCFNTGSKVRQRLVAALVFTKSRESCHTVDSFDSQMRHKREMINCLKPFNLWGRWASACITLHCDIKALAWKANGESHRFKFCSQWVSSKCSKSIFTLSWQHLVTRQCCLSGTGHWHKVP